VAAVNGPGAVVVSGDPDALAELVDRCTAVGVRAKVLPVDYACLPLGARRADPCRPGDGPRRPGPPRGRRPAVLHAHRRVARHQRDGRRLLVPQPARHRTVRGRHPRAGTARTNDVFVEVSPHPVLTVPVKETVESAGLDRRRGHGHAPAGRGRPAARADVGGRALGPRRHRRLEFRVPRRPRGGAAHVSVSRTVASGRRPRPPWTCPPTDGEFWDPCRPRGPGRARRCVRRRRRAARPGAARAA